MYYLVSCCFQMFQALLAISKAIFESPGTTDRQAGYTVHPTLEGARCSGLQLGDAWHVA